MQPHVCVGGQPDGNTHTQLPVQSTYREKRIILGKKGRGIGTQTPVCVSGHPSDDGCPQINPRAEALACHGVDSASHPVSGLQYHHIHSTPLHVIIACRPSGKKTSWQGETVSLTPNTTLACPMHSGLQAAAVPTVLALISLRLIHKVQ